MTSLFIGLYGLYFLVVGMRGNANDLLGYVNEDAPKYLPWLLAIAAIALLSEFDETRPMVKPFIALVSLNFVLMNFGTIQNETRKIFNASQS